MNCRCSRAEKKKRTQRRVRLLIWPTQPGRVGATRAPAVRRQAGRAGARMRWAPAGLRLAGRVGERRRREQQSCNAIKSSWRPPCTWQSHRDRDVRARAQRHSRISVCVVVSYVLYKLELLNLPPKSSLKSSNQISNK
jgi:hypothetical protein